MNQFEKSIDRKNTLSVKWNGMLEPFGSDDLLPMWVADMDFKPPTAVLDALKEQVDHGIFGYSLLGTSTASSIIDWIEKHHQWTIDREWLSYSHGVVPSISIAIQAFTNPGDKVLIQSPVYTPFFNMIKNNKRELVNSPLVLTNGKYEIDFADFEKQLKTGVKLFILCSPHNPAGRVWEKRELRRMADLCEKYNVIIISDEIHADLVHAPSRHLPIAAIDGINRDFIITLMAPSKTFNLPGLQASYMVVPARELRNQITSIQLRDGFSGLNTFGIVAMEAAYRHGEQWLDEVLDYIRGNIDYVMDELKKAMPKLTVIKPEGTYLVWIDCRPLGLTDKELRKLILEKGKLAVNFGEAYGPGGEGFIRLNVACSRDIVKEGIRRLETALADL